MEQRTDNKVVLVTQKTRLENLVKRYNTVGQAQFYIEHHGGDFADYQREHETYHRSVEICAEFLQSYGRLAIIDREFISGYMFGERDLVIAIGRDGLVANVLKYLTTQQLMGVNPDPDRWDGVLLPFCAEDVEVAVPDFFKGKRSTKSVTLAEARLNDNQVLYGVNDLFIGRKTHASARYEISINGRREIQSSSGIIVSTGLGSTGWLKSIIAGARGIGRYYGEDGVSESCSFGWDANRLVYNVREPYPSTSTGADIVYGDIERDVRITVTSLMPENGVIFSDGVEEDYLEFNSGAVASIGIASRKGMLVV